ncbi:MAG: hypothetical protein KY428_08875, partial [Bacteroidetes bacterium]|nr:hypothetical protein [Bacteroidota bacterium]
MNKYHRLLEQQLEHYFNSEPPAELRQFLEAVARSYSRFEEDHKQLEQAMGQKANELLAANEDLRKVNAELDRFVYSTSHDLRAPLLSVLGLVQLMENKKRDEDQQPYLNMMRNRINNLQSFIGDITAYAR